MNNILTSLALLLIYMPVVAVVYRIMFPYLTHVAKRVLQALLVFQALVIGLKIFYLPENDFIRWILVSGWEFNVPGAFGATQMLTACLVAFLAAWLARTEPTAKRPYLILIGIGFCAMTLDEYFGLWRLIALDIKVQLLGYAALGLPLAIAIIASALRSDKSARVWDLSLLAGIFLTGFAAIVVDELPTPCVYVGAPLTDVCLVMTHIEESLEMLGVWLALAAMLGKLTEIAPDPTPRMRAALQAAPIAFFSLLMLHVAMTGYGFDELRHVPHRLAMKYEVARIKEPNAVQFEGGVRVHGYNISHEPDLVSFRLYASSAQSENRNSGYSLHLVDQANRTSVASEDKNWCCPSNIRVYGPVCERRCKPRRIFPDWLSVEPLYRQQMEIELQPDAPRNRALWVVLTLWREQGGTFTRQAVISSDLQLLDDWQVVLSELVLAGDAPSGSPSPLAVFDTGVTLDAVNLPDRAQAAETLQLRFPWRSEADDLEDLAQFLHFVHQETGEWWSYDQQPLGPRLPTRLWYSGLADSETWRVPLPADLAPGRYEVFTGLYRAADQQRVAVVDADGAPWLDNRVALGSIVIENRTR